MSNPASSKKRKAGDGDTSPVAQADPPPSQPGFSSNRQPVKIDTQKITSTLIVNDSAVGEAEDRSRKRGCVLAGLVGAPAHESLLRCGDTLTLLIRQCGDSRHRNHADFGYFVDYSRVEAILKLLRGTPIARHPIFDMTIRSLEKAREAWPKTHIPAQRIISPLQNIFQHFVVHLQVVNKVAKGMNNLPQLRWWADSEYDINETLPNALACLAGLSASDCHVPRNQVCSIMVVLLKMAEITEFELPQAMLAALRDRPSPPNLLQECPLVFDLKLEAIRVQISNVQEKYHRAHGVLAHLAEETEKLEAEVKSHEKKISKS